MSIKRLIKASQALIEPYDWIFKVPQTRWLALQGIKSLHGNSIAYLATRWGSNSRLHSSDVSHSLDMSSNTAKFQDMSRLVGKPTMWFPNRSDTNRPVQLQKQARSLKFWIHKVEELYYPCSENKGADQLRSYREADLRLCFRICRLLVFP